jgi:hypothetical protein
MDGWMNEDFRERTAWRRFCKEVQAKDKEFNRDEMNSYQEVVILWRRWKQKAVVQLLKKIKRLIHTRTLTKELSYSKR